MRTKAQPLYLPPQVPARSLHGEEETGLQPCLGLGGEGGTKTPQTLRGDKAPVARALGLENCIWEPVFPLPHGQDRPDESQSDSEHWLGTLPGKRGGHGREACSPVASTLLGPLCSSCICTDSYWSQTFQSKRCYQAPSGGRKSSVTRVLLRRHRLGQPGPSCLKSMCAWGEAPVRRPCPRLASVGNGEE